MKNINYLLRIQSYANHDSAASILKINNVFTGFSFPSKKPSICIIMQIENNFKARSYNAAVLELSKLPESVLKGIGMNHSNVSYKTYELIYGKK